MKRILCFGTILICLSLSSCQCSNKPDIGPVEGQEQQAQVNEALPSLPAESTLHMV